jgi:hypothetical protein
MLCPAQSPLVTPRAEPIKPPASGTKRAYLIYGFDFKRHEILILIKYAAGRAVYQTNFRPVYTAKDRFTLSVSRRAAVNRLKNRNKSLANGKKRSDDRLMQNKLG